MDFPVFFLAGSLTLLGVGYFCFDLYRNRNRRLFHFEDSAALSNIGVDTSDLTRIADSTHAVEDASNGLGHCVEAIAHTLSHH
jgi:hypothetical protein